jgi:hypothetical protein
MKFDQAYNIMKNGGRIRRTTWYPTIYLYMDKNGKIKQNYDGMGGEILVTQVPIKDVFANDWCEVKENTLIFQYDDSSIAVEVENGFRIKVQEGDSTATYCPSVGEARKIADILLRGVKNYEVHYSKSI